MSMSHNPGKEQPIVYVRKKIRKTKRMEEIFGNVVTSPAQQEFSTKRIGEKSFEPLHKDHNKLFGEKCVAKKEAKTKRGTKCSNNSKSLNTRQCKGRGAANTKISDNKEERRKIWNPYTSDFNKYSQILTTDDETYWNQLGLVDGNIYYERSQYKLANDLGETAHTFAHTNVNNTSWGTSDAKTKGKMVHQENNNAMDFADFYAQRGNKGINICEKSVNSSSEEMGKLLGTSNNHFGGLHFQFQNMNQVTPNYFLSDSMNEMNAWRRYHKPRAIVHPSKIISPSRFSQNSDQNMQITSEPATSNFSYMKLLTEDGNDSTLFEELLNEKQFVSTTQNSLSSEEQRVQQWDGSQVGNYEFDSSLQQINLQSCQYQVLQQVPQQMSYMDLLTREDISWILFA
ncbi:uncharacterized protein LOC132599943 isoform X2 [Lycium barbarum]|uniref:uncharacterized protein LOC132599943 isoform X2 n=1 Tax=Lycium barbarum TaxID=112863 RepID=UPI00293E37D2|nr:uncharacterized protein LOC132599943 isoform X2 [Lycium barbarum]